jgi:hypothetical protein
MSLDQIAEKHGVDIQELQMQLEKGMQHEQDEHTKGGTEIAKEIAEIIALHHLEEMPDYYDRLDKIETTPEIQPKIQPVTDIQFQNDDIIEFYEINTDLQEDDFEKEEDKQEEVKYYYVWYDYPRETYDFNSLADAVNHIRERDLRAEVRDYDGRKIMGYKEIENVINYKNGFDEYEREYEKGIELKEQYKEDEFLQQQKNEADVVLFSVRPQTEKFMICNAYIDVAREKMAETQNETEKRIWQQAISIWEQTLDEIDDALYTYEEGGDTGGCGCTKYLSKKLSGGGLAYGNSHDKGGMPMKVKSTGQNIEIEGGEGVINKRSMQSTEKVTFQGKSMTPCEVISKINEMGGGVKFDCSDVKEIIEKDGEF